MCMRSMKRASKSSAARNTSKVLCSRIHTVCTHSTLEMCFIVTRLGGNQSQVLSNPNMKVRALFSAEGRAEKNDGKRVGGLSDREEFAKKK